MTTLNISLIYVFPRCYALKEWMVINVLLKVVDAV